MHSSGPAPQPTPPSAQTLGEQHLPASPPRGSKEKRGFSPASRRLGRVESSQAQDPTRSTNLSPETEEMEGPNPVQLLSPHEIGPEPEPEFQKEWKAGTSLMVHWLRLRAPKAGAWVRSPVRIPAAKTWCSQINIKKRKESRSPTAHGSTASTGAEAGGHGNVKTGRSGFPPSYLSRGHVTFRASQEALVAKNSPAKARNAGSIPGSGRSPGRGHGNPLQHPCLENPMDRGAWQATVHRVSQSQTRLKRLSMHAVISTIKKNKVG